MPVIDIDTWKLLTEWAKIVGAMAVFLIGLWQYSKAQKWKRREFIASHIKEFEGDRKIQLAMTMLDWNDRELYFPSEASRDPIPVRVDDGLLCGALLPHEAANGYYPNEALIRDCIDHFLEMLVRLENFLEAKLIKLEELRPYISYWIRLVSGQMAGWHRPEVHTLLLNYIQKYGFAGAGRLIEQFGYNPIPPQTAIDEAVNRTVEERSRHVWQTGSDSVSQPPVP
jgi:hypothetical protein